MSDHRTHVEHDEVGYYWWCESDDCYAPRRPSRYPTEREAADAAHEHEAYPG
jgi:hypothetical protein